MNFIGASRAEQMIGKHAEEIQRYFDKARVRKMLDSSEPLHDEYVVLATKGRSSSRS